MISETPSTIVVQKNQSQDMVIPLRPTYIPHNYMDPLGTIQKRAPKCGPRHSRKEPSGSRPRSESPVSVSVGKYTHENKQSTHVYIYVHTHIYIYLFVYVCFCWKVGGGWPGGGGGNVIPREFPGARMAWALTLPSISGTAPCA